MTILNYYHHRVAITFTVFGIVLSCLFGYSIFTVMQKIDDGIRKTILVQYQKKVEDEYRKTAKIIAKDSVFPITTVIIGKNSFPEYFAQLNNGYHEFEEYQSHVIKGDMKNRQGDSVQYLLIHNDTSSHYINQNIEEFVFSILIIVLFVSAVGLSIGLLLSRQITRPVRALHQQISSTDPNQMVLTALDRRDEFGEISAAYSTTLKRIKQAFEREKRFSMYASHELRTPVSIIKSSVNLWQKCEQLTDQQQANKLKQKALQRIITASQMMEEVIQTFLLLSKRASGKTELEQLDIKQLLNELLDKYQSIESYQRITVNSELENPPILTANSLIASVILSTLLRNSFEYCADQVTIELSETNLRLSNNIDQLKIEQAEHFGFGMEIVHQLCEQLDWKAQVEERQETLFIVNIQFS